MDPGRIKVTSRDVEEIVSKLTSDKAKTRDEGIKLLGTWLQEGERSKAFCRYLSDKTSSLKHNEAFHCETWPFLVKVLMQCVSLEISTSKKRLPKMTYAKALKVFISRAEDVEYSGKKLLLLPVAKLIFNHVSDVILDVPSFLSEYIRILQCLLPIKDYRFQLRKRVYSSLVVFHMKKVEASLITGESTQTNLHDDSSRTLQTLQLLLENPPGDFPDDIREAVIKSFVAIFKRVRKEDNNSRKLMDCVNIYLLKDGPNLGCKSLDIHEEAKKFVFQRWSEGHDKKLKESFVVYAKLQLSLMRGAADGTTLLAQVLDVVSKELDQMCNLGTSLLRADSTLDEKRYLTRVVELAALVFCQACSNTSKAPAREKRPRQEHLVVQIKERLVEGKWAWHAVFCCLIRNYSTRINKDIFIYWFENLSTNLGRIINNANMEHPYDGLLWTLRSLLELSSLLLFAAPNLESSRKSSTPLTEVDKGWRVIWSCLMHVLPMFVKIPTLVDAALMILCNILLTDTKDSYSVSLEIWDLQVFKYSPSISVLCFISCYFSRRASQYNPHDALYTRQTTLRAILTLLSSKEHLPLDVRLIVAVPAAAFAVCAGSAPLLIESVGLSQTVYFSEQAEEMAKAGELPIEYIHGNFECSVEMLAKIDKDFPPQVSLPEHYQHMRLPGKLRDQLLHEMENYILDYIKDKESEKEALSEIIDTCALLSNFMYCSYSTRIREEASSFFSNLGKLMLTWMDRAITVVDKACSDIVSGGLGLNSVFGNIEKTAASFKRFLSSPLLSIKWEEKYDTDAGLYSEIVQSAERLLTTLAKLYEGCSGYMKHLNAKVEFPNLSEIHSVHDPVRSHSSESLHDMELDSDRGLSDINSLAIDADHTSSIPKGLVNYKLAFVSIMSGFFSILPLVTWEILFNLKVKESDPKVHENILLSLCQHPHWSSSSQLLDLIMSMADNVNLSENLKLHSSDMLGSIYRLVESLLHLDGIGNSVALFSRKIVSDECFIALGDLVHKVAETSSLDWFDRVKLVGCMCNFVLLRPQIAQSMIEKLFLMIRDPDYRVRFSLARRIGVLFQTWDGHVELFEDICSNFGVRLVSFSREKIVQADEVLADGPQPREIMETTILTIMHLVLHSEKIELEAIFMICAVAAIDPCQRELVGAVLDSLSKELSYMDRTKYMEELMGPILFYWISCRVSLPALVETRDLFVSNVEPINFVQYCCQWLLPALILKEDYSNIEWVAKVARQTSAELVKHHFVHIFSICMALHCSKKPGWEKGSRALGISILRIAEISEHDRDELIWKCMVSIVNYILSLASSVPDPPLPFFSKDTIACAIVTVVDGFLDSEGHSTSINLIDKIHIFRPDRVFMFIVDIHYKVTAAVRQSHKRNHFTAVEVLVDLLGHRAGLPSTFNYLLNLIGQFIGCHSLMDQCCHIMSTLLKIFKDNLSGETTRLLGERLQFLVSKLVECCICSESCGKPLSTAPPEVVSLLHQLTVGSNPSLYEYIKELEPFPDFGLFDDVKRFHFEISRAYSPRVHLLNLVKRSYHVSPASLLCSLKALHKHLFTSEIHQGAVNDEYVTKDIDWHSDDEIVHAVWNLVQICSLDDSNNLSSIVSDFVSRTGIRDPHRVVFDLSGEFNGLVSGMVKGISLADANRMDTGISDEVLLMLTRLLKKYLMDESAEIIDMSSHALRGILSTEKGRRMLAKLDSYESSLIEVHSNGVNLETVLCLINNLQQKFDAESMSIEDSTVWTTFGKTFDAWIRPLVCVLISYCDDHILRLCQDIVLVKSEVAELLFSSVIVNLSRRNNSEIDLCKIISLKVHENILIESNVLIKSIQILLNALNELRLYHVMERIKCSSVLHKPRNSKQTKPTGSLVKSRTTSVKVKDHQTHSESATPILLWDKVYWLSVDYLTVAKSAIDCGSYFTAVLYVEHWCEEHFNGLSLGTPDFSHKETLPPHIEILVSAVTQINEPDSIYGIIRSHKLTSQIITFEHEGSWSKALEYYDLQVRSEPILQPSASAYSSPEKPERASRASYKSEHGLMQKRPYKGLIRSLQHIGCTHVLDMYCQGLTSQRGRFQHDLEFSELQYEAAWRGGNWDFSPLYSGVDAAASLQYGGGHHFNENLLSGLRALQEGEFDEFRTTLEDSKQTLLVSICHASNERTEFMYSTILKLQIFYHLGMAWDLRWRSSYRKIANSSQRENIISEPMVPSKDQLQWLHKHWNSIVKQAELHMNLLEPFIAFRRVLLQVLSSSDSSAHHLLESASILRKGSRFSEAAAALHEFKFLCSGMGEVHSNFYWLGRLEEAKLLRAQGQHEMAISLADHISQNNQLSAETADVLRLVGKWLAETRSSNSRTILEKFLKKAVTMAEDHKSTAKLSMEKINQMHFHLAHYADALFRSHEERLGSNEWQVAMRLRKHKTKELEALIKRFKSTAKGDKIDYTIKIQELQKQLMMDREEAEKLQEDRDNFLCTALEGYKRCMIIGEKYDIQVVFRLVSLWFSLSNRQIVVDSMLSTIKEVQSYKFILLVYQIASRMGGTGDSSGLPSFQFALVSLVKKMSLDHPHHTIFQLLALANGDRIKDKQRSRNSFVVDMDKKVAAEDLLKELSSYHGSTIRQMKQMVEIYIKLAELETKREDTNKKVPLPRELRSIRELERVPVITAYVPIDRTCRYPEGYFPYFRGLTDSITVMNGINAPKVVECLGSDGKRYRQLAKSGNDDLRQDAVMEQFFGLVNTFLQNNRDTWKRRLNIRTYKVVPFTPSAGVLEWVNGTLPLGEYLIGSSRNGGAHGRYGVGDWTFLKCRQLMTAETDKCKAFQEVCENFRPVMHYFFLERFSNPADWFDKRLAYTRSIAASSMVGYIVGLGDRHSMNVLIDQATAEVVHIDLGVAFEQGLMLKTPERVPFRLTRDIIDGMGVTGTEGVFRRCCEETLSVMRSNKEALLTIIEVFIHDPLYKWALSPLKAMQRQKDIDDDIGASLEDSDEDGYEGNKDAARALLRVKQKLDGYEDGEMRSVRGQVQQLVQDAIDPDRLCNMFPGWGAWM